MPYDMQRATQPIQREVRTRPHTVATKPRVSRSAANEATISAEATRTIEPMLLVHQEQMETFRLLFAAIRRGYRALTRAVTA